MSVTFLTDKDPILRHDSQSLTPEQQVRARENIGIIDNPDIHAEYFTITEDGVLSLKDEFGVTGSRNAELPKHLVIPEVVEIPGIVGDVAVDSIAPGAFYGNMAIKTVTLPRTLKEIPEACFQNSTVEIVNNTENITSVGKSAFYQSDIKSINLPNLKSLGEGAFMTCSHLTHANVGGITEMPADGFYKCYGLSRIESDNLITSVGHTAFHNTPRLANADFVQNLTSIGAGAFIKSGLDFDWSSLGLPNDAFGNNATPLQFNPTDFWSACTFTPCENPLPTLLAQRDPRWSEEPLGIKGKKWRQGCLVFSLMHAYCGLHDLHLSHVDEFEEIIKNCETPFWDTFEPRSDMVKTYAEGLELSAEEFGGYNQENLQKLYDALAAGKYAILVSSGGATSGAMHGHSVLAYGITPSGKIMLADSSERYYHDKEAGGATYALPYKSLTSPTIPGDAVVCIIVGK